MKKKKIGFWETVGVGLALATWASVSADLPGGGDIVPPATRPDPPTCPRFTYAKWDDEAKEWRCVPRGLL